MATNQDGQRLVRFAIMKQASERRTETRNRGPKSVFLARNTNCYFSKASLLLHSCTQEPPAIQKEPCFASELLLLFLVALRNQELQIRHPFLPPEIPAQGNVHVRGATDLWRLHSQQFQGRDVWLLGLAVLSTQFPCC